MYTKASEPDRVRRHTAGDVLDRIEHEIESSIRAYSTRSKDEIGARIEELEREWDMERVLETNAATLALSAALLGLTVNKKFLLITCGVLGFLFQHAASGWCPPVPLFRRLGIRTRSEIDREKFALKAIRGDFRDIPQVNLNGGTQASDVLQSVNR